ncbi:MAG: hypothetical protein HY749_10195 [Gammaproteobacteria bacterium]|nr:hypothetical protein [Gammaproteobacteria bacterium]MBI5615688.1 hypothetical protein [Gammaproteobacteria bacterium]
MKAKLGSLSTDKRSGSAFISASIRTVIILLSMATGSVQNSSCAAEAGSRWTKNISYSIEVGRRNEVCGALVEALRSEEGDFDTFCGPTVKSPVMGILPLVWDSYHEVINERGASESSNGLIELIDRFYWSRDVNPIVGVRPEMWKDFRVEDAAAMADAYAAYIERFRKNFDIRDGARLIGIADIDNDEHKDVLYRNSCSFLYGGGEGVIVLDDALRDVDEERSELLLVHARFERASSSLLSTDGEPIQNSGTDFVYDVFSFQGTQYLQQWHKDSKILGNGELRVFAIRNGDRSEECLIRSSYRD